VFLIKKKSEKWRLLIDLRNVNESMVTMGALEPGLPTPACIPKERPLIVLDLQDCSYTTSIDPKDREGFAFSVPSLNQQEHLQRYKWTVLPQGMTISPTMCQYFVGKILLSIKITFPDAYIIHYMDDILISHACSKQIHKIFETTQKALQVGGLVIAPEKIQTTTPFQHLGHAVKHLTVHPQKAPI
jgi:hypothetical protein